VYREAVSHPESKERPDKVCVLRHELQFCNLVSLNGISRLLFVIETHRVLWDIRAEFLNPI
jgi:hypothetical protein